MSSTALLAVLSILVFLGGSALAVLVLVIVSIHRTANGPMSGVYGERRGGLSRRMLTGTRTNGKGESK
jgi:hypothetical protein